MTSKNDITGDLIKSKTNSENYQSGWDRIFGNKKRQQLQEDEAESNKSQDEELENE